MKKFLYPLVAACLLGGCAAVKTGAGAAAGAGEAVVKTAASASADVATAPLKHDDEAAPDDGEPRPYDPTRDAMADVNAALAAAAESRKNVLLVLAGNWCHDSRGLAAKFEQPPLAEIIAERYELVFVDVGYRDRNLDVARRFGVDELLGTPTVLVLSPDGALLNAASVHDSRSAASKPYAVTLDYFERYSRID